MGALDKQHRCFFLFALATRWSALQAVFLSRPQNSLPTNHGAPYFLIQFFSSSNISSCMQGIDGCMHVCVYVHEYDHACPWERSDVCRAKQCISQRSISGPLLAATCRVSRSSPPVHQAPVISQKFVGGERRACKGCRSVYLSLAVLASDGRSRLSLVWTANQLIAMSPVTKHSIEQPHALWNDPWLAKNTLSRSEYRAKERWWSLVFF